MNERRMFAGRPGFMSRSKKYREDKKVATNGK